MIEVELPDGKIEAELADSFFERTVGLSGRSGGKMLFVFPRETRTRVDMMLLSEPLHLYFLDSDRNVIGVQRAEPWSWDPRTWRLYSPSEPYRYLLESFEELDVEEGDSME
ncbi:MAG: DUF192 domain-containing protein, partial [Candidatus Nanohaloarchaea archaeon]|nr:DUF192 domain-containing protein [Candidatus Nanohaloarchaea archaeon]